MKNKKRNITMIAVLLFVCAAVLLNWSYNNRWGEPDAEMVSAEDEAMAQANALSGEESVAASYFAEARLTRQVSRDEALQLLFPEPKLNTLEPPNRNRILYFTLKTKPI